MDGEFGGRGQVCKQPGSDDGKQVAELVEQDQTYLVAGPPTCTDGDQATPKGHLQEKDIDGYLSRNPRHLSDKQEPGSTADDNTQILKDSEPDVKNLIGIFG